ncbi:L-asparaginase [Virgibacillus profundi]|uniref:asparaginase n=1 Tax=Virgibacillus profundi TaxID=2024555 RepID=A0A2A2IDE1_9BACI|nr:asparaginase [Virgibacillus profundi]PAV29592.1 L-asparaginase [Virgibacillus profundi]PXY53764.1 asparaginase [Virgibacillus profundi]
MKDILIIHTGGTISMLENKETGEITTTGKHPLTDAQYFYQTYANINEIFEYDLPSPQITPKHMLGLAKRIKDVISSYDGIVVTHGTDTLEETAYFLNLVLETDKPVILTGAMRSSNEIGSDGLYNLISSIRVAVEDEASYKGVLVVMNDEIHTAGNVTKTSTNNVATFQSPQFGPIGIITKDSIIFHHTVISRYTHSVESISKNVFLLKAYAGMDQPIIHALHQANPDGLVIEGLGQGNLPKEAIIPLQKILDDQIPVVLVSRCYQGIVQPTYGYEGGGRQLKEMGVIFTNGLTGPKARIKLLIALEKTKDFSLLKRIFEKEL